MRYSTVLWLVALIMVGSVRQGLAQDVPRPACDTLFLQGDMNDCAAKSAQWSEHRLALLLAELSDTLKTDGIASLGGVQAKWQAFREAQCSWERDNFDGGTMAPLAYSSCLAGVTEDRIAELKGFLCTKGGGDCVASRRYDLEAP